MAEHKDLTGADLHEPKGAASAGLGTVYQSNGSGSGTWAKIGPSNLTSSLPTPNQYALTVTLADVSAASNVFVAVPFNSTFVRAYATLGAAITVADSNLSFEKNGAVSFGSALVIAFTGSAAGTTFTFTPTINTSVNAGQFIKVITDGASTTTASLYITLILEKT